MQSVINIVGKDIKVVQSEYYPYNMMFLDKLINSVRTEYFFLTTSEWLLVDNYMITFSKNILKQFPEVGQILPNEMERYGRNSNKYLSLAFTFSPGLHRISDFKKIGSFSKVAGAQAIVNLDSE